MMRPTVVKMLAKELQQIGYPSTYVVNKETFLAVETYLLDWLAAQGRTQILTSGPHMGLMFKNVELIFHD